MADTSQTRLRYLDETAQPGVAEVTACLDDEAEPVRLLAAAVLGRLGPPAVSGLVQALAKTQPAPVRAIAACSLATLGPAAAPAVTELCRCLTDDDDTLRDAAAVALGKVGADAVPYLTRMLQFSSPAVVDAARSALNAIGPPDPAALPPLEHAMANPDPAARQAAVKKAAELRRGGPPPAIPRLLALLGDPVPAVRAEACLTLARIQAPPGQSVPALSHALLDPVADVRLNAVIALSPHAQDVTPQLDARLSDPDPRVAAAAQAALSPPKVPQ